jgi:hypothetical protein
MRTMIGRLSVMPGVFLGGCPDGCGLQRNVDNSGLTNVGHFRQAAAAGALPN